MISLSDLLTSSTEEEIQAQILEYLTALGFSGTSWQSGSWQLHIVAVAARIISDVSSVVPQIAAGGFIRLATGDWKTLLAYELYDVTRQAAVNSVGEMVLAASAGSPGATIAAGDIVIADSPTDPANTFRNTTGGTLSPGGTLTLTMEAEVAGADGNIPTATTLYMWTPLVGVSATNPAIGATSTWLTTVGVDEESDERLEERCLGKWATRSYGVGDGAYKTWALEADSTVTRVLVQAENPFDAGSVNVVCATAVGGISGAQETAILAYINGADGVARRPLGDVVTVESATTNALAFTGDVVVASGSTTTLATVQTAITEFLGQIPIGGLVIPPASAGRFVLSQLITKLQNLPDVIAVHLTDPSSDVVLLYPSKVIWTPTFSVTVTYV